MPKVAALIGNLNKEHGGAQQLLYDIYTNLASDDFELTVYYMFGEGTYEEDFKENGVTVVDLNAKSNTDVTTFFRFIRTLRQTPPDILHTNSPISGIWGRIGGALAGVPHILSVEHTVHNRYPPLPRYLNGITLPLADTIVAVSPAVLESLRSWENLLIPSSVEKRTIPNGISVKEIESNIKSAQLDVNEIELGNADPVLGTVGRLAEAKGYEFLIRAMPRVMDKYSNAKLIIVGGGPLKSRLEEIAGEEQVAEDIIFVGYQANVFPYLKNFDIGVFPSIWEGFGLSLAEAAVAKCPIVASDIPAFRSIIGEAGVFAEPGNPQSLAEGILWSLDNPQRRRRYQKEAYDRVSNRYSIEQVTESYARLYREVADEEAGRM